MKIILASKSPRRKELLKQIVPNFEIFTTDTQEITDKRYPQQIVMDLATKKALPVLALRNDCCVIGSDTIVVYCGKILGKPKDAQDAVAMLTQLGGNVHTVYTGVCIATADQLDVFYDQAKVTFRTLTAQQIADYVATGSPMDKAGAYGIQDSGFVANIDGSYTCVMGLPTEKLQIHLNKILEEYNG